MPGSAVPKKRTSHSKKGTRRSHDHLTAVRLTKCANCGQMTRPHMVCTNCGYYRGQPVVKV